MEVQTKEMINSEALLQELDEQESIPKVVKDPLLEEKPKKVRRLKQEKTVLSLIPYRRIISEDCFAMEKEVTNFYRIEDASARDGSEQQRQEALNDYLVFLRTVHHNVKEIFTSFPVDMSENIDYARRRFKMRKGNKNVQAERSITLNQLEYLDNNKPINTVYLQIFASDEEELKDVEREIMSVSSANFRPVKMSLTQKIKLLVRLYNPLSTIPIGVPYQDTDETGRRPDVQKIVDKKGYDPLFIGQIQPLGGLRPYSPTELQIGNGFIRVLNLMVYRPKNNPNFWGQHIFNMKNAVTTLDMRSIDVANPMVEKKLNNSLEEYEDQVATSKSRISQKKAKNEYYKLDQTVEHILEGQEVLKEIHVRYILSAESIEELNAQEKEVHIQLGKRQFQASCFLDEQERQFKASFVSFTQGRKLIRRKGKEIKGSALAGSYPFHFTNHIDPDAPYSGYPLYGSGIICLSPTHKDHQRKSYSMMIIGSQGFGKTTVSKKLAKQFVEYGNNHFGFYMSDETKRLTEYLGGIHLDGAEARLNPCQIYASDVDAKTKKTKEQQSYLTNLTKMRLIFALNNEIKSDDPVMVEAKKLFPKAYAKYMEDHNLDLSKITQYDPEQYPIYSDILDFAKKEQASEVEEFRKKSLYQLVSQLESFIDNSGNIFNQPSEFDFSHRQLVTFDMQNLIKSDRATYNAQYYNLYTAAFSEAVRVGQREKYLFDRKQKRVDELIYTNITSDEFHNPIRTENLTLLNELDRYNREARKLLIGQTFILHDIADAFPDYTDGKMGEISKAVMNLFKLTTYRFLLQQDSSSEELMKKIFGKQLSNYDLAEIFKFEERDILLNIKGATNIKFRYDLTDREKEIFDGGL